MMKWESCTQSRCKLKKRRILLDSASAVLANFYSDFCDASHVTSASRLSSSDTRPPGMPSPPSSIWVRISSSEYSLPTFVSGGPEPPDRSSPWQPMQLFCSYVCSASAVSDESAPSPSSPPSSVVTPSSAGWPDSSSPPSPSPPHAPSTSTRAKLISNQNFF